MPEPLRRLSLWIVLPVVVLAAAVLPGLWRGQLSAQQMSGVDSDADGLPDEWELARFGDLSRHADEDADGDTLGNAFELEIGTDPTNPDTDGDGRADWMGIAGYLLQERWTPGESWPAESVGRRDEYNRPGAVEFFQPGAEYGPQGDSYVQRLRGRIVAPVTGDYTFWISGDNGCEMWLGTDAEKFGARRIASIDDPEGWSAVEEWDKFPSQTSGAVRLEAGAEYYLEILHRNAKGADHLEIAWRYPGAARHVVPPSALRSYIPSPDDSDDDGMSDRWEREHNLEVGRNDALEDADGDGLTNIIEHDMGGDPGVAGPVSGMLTWSRWTDMPGLKGEPLTRSPGWGRAPDRRDAAFGMELPENYGSNVWNQLSGTLTVPEDGLYSFWISGDDQAELWLAGDSHRYNKRLIASCPSYVNPGEWSRFISQRSVPVRLKAGERYHIEARHRELDRNDHLATGWQHHGDTEWTTAMLGGTRGDWTDDGDTAEARVRGGGAFGASTGESLLFRHSAAAARSEMICHVDSIRSMGPGAGCGMMFRASLDPLAPYVAAVVDSTGRVGIHFRAGDADSALSWSIGQVIGDETWLRLVANDGDCRAYWSVDGVEWKEAGMAGVVFGETMVAGPVAWGPEGGATVRLSRVVLGGKAPAEAIPAQFLSTFSPDPADADDDALPDPWEEEYGLDATSSAGKNGEFGDPDGDSLPNVDEFRLGSDPLAAGGVPGRLTRDIWFNIQGDRVADLVDSDRYYREPDKRDLVPGPDVSNSGIWYGERLRGMLVAPVSGTYRFWIAGDDACRLLISPSADKFGRTVVASLPDTDRVWTEYQDWDVYPGQASSEIRLVGGREYFLEILHKQRTNLNHVSVAWAYQADDGTIREREVIPPAVLRSYSLDPRDLDDDELPDDWERANGLDPTAGGGAGSTEGVLGDLDGDGLNNLEEFEAGTRADLADTDGDGIDDGTELRTLGTDPLAIDVAPFVLVAELDAISISDSKGDWGNEGRWLLNRRPRGWVEYEFNVPAAGVHLLEVEAHSWTGRAPSGDCDLVVSVGGVRCGRVPIVVDSSGQATARVLTPWLSSGSHTVRLFLDNASTHWRWVMRKVRLLSADGSDEDDDGIPDWAGQLVTSRNGFDSDSIRSRISPACVEGRATYPALATGLPLAAAPNGRWYSDVTLNADGSPVPLAVSFENGAISTGASVTWEPTNLLAEPAQVVRQGDSLLLTATESQTGHQDAVESVSLGIEGRTLEFAANTPQAYRFDNPGSVELAVTVTTAAGARNVRAAVVVVPRPEATSPVFAPAIAAIGRFPESPRTWWSNGMPPCGSTRIRSPMPKTQRAGSRSRPTRRRISPPCSAPATTGPCSRR